MPADRAPQFLTGVIEGFYGPPWSLEERYELFAQMAAWSLGAYLYAPKDDLKHRASWRTPYDQEEAAALRRVTDGCRQQGIEFLYALSPGLDVRYADPQDAAHMRAKFAQMLELGSDGFALLFDDIPDRMHEDDRRRWGSFAAAQCALANDAWAWLQQQRPAARMLFCPTPYCGRMAQRGLGGADYLDVVGRELAPEIDVCWTGPEIISEEITVAHVTEVAARLRRPPVLWDNLHANDYDGRRFFCGPYAGRPPELRGAVRGILCNPNCEFPLNFPALRTFAAYLQADDAWDPRAAYEEAVAAWAPRFTTLSGAPSVAELTLLTDCYYLPYAEGSTAVRLRTCLERVLAWPSAAWDGADREFLDQAGRLRDLCGRLAELRDRRLFAALHRRTWELREELDLLLGFVAARVRGDEDAFRSDFHLPRTYRGGMVAQLQRTLQPRDDGGFAPAASVAAAVGRPEERA